MAGSICYAIGPYIFSSLAAFVGRWLISLIGKAFHQTDKNEAGHTAGHKAGHTAIQPRTLFITAPAHLHTTLVAVYLALLVADSQLEEGLLISLSVCQSVVRFVGYA